MGVKMGVEEEENSIFYNPYINHVQHKKMRGREAPHP